MRLTPRLWFHRPTFGILDSLFHPARRWNERRRAFSTVCTQMKVGDICYGVVTRAETFGLFVEVDGVPGLLRVPELTWGHLSHPSDVAAVGERVRFQILQLNDPKERPHEHFNGSITALVPKPSNETEDEAT